MKENDLKIIILGIIACIAFFIIISLVGVAYINNSPGGYKYIIDIEGLDHYQSGLITDIIVPLPYRNGLQEFPDEDLQLKAFGDWRSMLVVTPNGKMLAFQSIGRNLTDIHAEFYTSYPEGIKIENITRESFYPVLPFMTSEYTQWIAERDPARAYSTIIYIPDSIRPVDTENANITFNLELVASEGMQHSLVGKMYQVTIREVFPPGVHNWTRVVAQVVQLR